MDETQERMGQNGRRMRLVESEMREDWDAKAGSKDRRRQERTAGRDGRARRAGEAEPARKARGNMRAEAAAAGAEEEGTRIAAAERTRRGSERGNSESVAADRRTSGTKGEKPEMTLEQKLRARKVRRIRRVLLTFGIAALAAYSATAVYFGFHFYEGTQIYGIDCSQKTVEEVKREVAERLGDYRLEIQERGGKSEYLGADAIGLTFVDNSSIDRMLRGQHSYVWPVTMLLGRGTMDSVAFSFDEKAAASALGMLDCLNPALEVAPKDAYVKTTDTGFVVEPEVMGTTLDPARTQEAVFAAIDAGETSVSLDEQGCYVDPELYEDDEELQRVAAEKSALAKAYITYDFGDRKEVVNAPLIADWIVTRADGSFVIDDVCVTDYVEALAAKYDTFGLTREFYTSLGTTETLTGGDYGWCIDQDATIVALLNALAEGYQGTMEPEYVYTGMCRDTNDIGYTYVEVCISQQRMWCYENGVCIVDTPVVTGNPNKDNATPSGGVWAIDAKKRNAILVGEGYQSPVDYWMPFNGDVGIHDMQTRAYFGSTIYLTNGSHGCVNTPYDAAQTIYNAVSVGTPVVVYE